jgi:hypothetical protein
LARAHPEEVSGSVVDRAANLVEEMRTPSDLTSNIVSEREDKSEDKSISDESSLERVDSLASESDPGEKAARIYMTEDALF